MKMKMSPKRRIVMRGKWTFSVPKYIYQCPTGWQIIVKLEGQLKLTKLFQFKDYLRKEGSKEGTKANIQNTLDAAEAYLQLNIKKIDLPATMNNEPTVSLMVRERKDQKHFYLQGSVGHPWSRVYVGNETTATKDRAVEAARTLVGRLRYYTKQRQAGVVAKHLRMPDSVPLPRASDKEVQKIAALV